MTDAPWHPVFVLAPTRCPELRLGRCFLLGPSRLGTCVKQEQAATCCVGAQLLRESAKDEALTNLIDPPTGRPQS
jgi:hypothetical protein